MSMLTPALQALSLPFTSIKMILKKVILELYALLVRVILWVAFCYESADERTRSFKIKLPLCLVGKSGSKK